jgi:hypothetical protein
LAPDRRASERPIAIACFRLVTFLRERPERSVPRFISRIARSTFLPAFFPYFRRAFRRPPLRREVLRDELLREDDFRDDDFRDDDDLRFRFLAAIPQPPSVVPYPRLCALNET